MKELTPEDFLIKNNVLKPDYTTDQQFPLNLSRDTNIQTCRDIVLSMVEYAKYISDDKEILIKLLKRTADLIYMDENLWKNPKSKKLYYEITKTINYYPTV